MSAVNWVKSQIQCHPVVNNDPFLPAEPSVIRGNKLSYPRQHVHPSPSCGREAVAAMSVLLPKPWWAVTCNLSLIRA